MTIALAIHADDGIVMAADTLISTGYLKGDEVKIVPAGGFTLGQAGITLSSIGMCAFVGAGDAGYVDALRDDLARVFLDNPDAIFEDLRANFEHCLRTFYKEHVVPFATFPSDDRLSLEPVIG